MPPKVERRLRARRLRQRGRPDATRRTGTERRRMASDPELAEIQRVYLELAALPRTAASNRTPQSRALVARIRALVDARTKVRGDEMIIVSHE